MVRAGAHTPQPDSASRSRTRLITALFALALVLVGFAAHHDSVERFVHDAQCGLATAVTEIGDAGGVDAAVVASVASGIAPVSTVSEAGGDGEHSLLAVLVCLVAVLAAAVVLAVARAAGRAWLVVAAASLRVLLPRPGPNRAAALPPTALGLLRV